MPLPVPLWLPRSLNCLRLNQPDRHAYGTDSKKHRTRQLGPTSLHDLPRNVELLFGKVSIPMLEGRVPFDPPVKSGQPAALTAETSFEWPIHTEHIYPERAWRHQMAIASAHK
jgi:hypothetical protein